MITEVRTLNAEENLNRMPSNVVQKIQSMVKTMANDKVINKLLKSLCKHLALLWFFKNSFVEHLFYI
ncbi:MAG: hypothetical protein IPK91_03405 [Saprospiraceae bacterium]|jgi:hypothetical protein|nr:hypothetical protein [Saprospiraceae bacterium]MBK8296331.1 hypothetical protein [Saprospiraceae bacterium]